MELNLQFIGEVQRDNDGVRTVTRGYRWVQMSVGSHKTKPKHAGKHTKHTQTHCAVPSATVQNV